MIESVLAGLRAHLLCADQYSSFAEEHQILAAVGFNQPLPASHRWPQVSIEMPRLAGQGDVEVWCSTGPVTYTQEENLQLAMDGSILAGVITCDAADAMLEANTQQLYQQIFAACERHGYPTLFRMWNYLPRINDHNGELERYRAFCKGRATAFMAQGFPDSFLPAGTGIGCQSKQLSVFFLAGKGSCRVNIENPRQMPAYEYPKQYGPKSPSFARATLYDGSEPLLFVSGTSSILGHESVHGGDIHKQCQTSLENIQALITGENLARYNLEGGASLEDLVLVKVYLRRPQDLDGVRAQCEAAFSEQAPIVYLAADICRGDLLVEIEGHVHFTGRRL